MRWKDVKTGEGEEGGEEKMVGGGGGDDLDKLTRDTTPLAVP